MVETVNMEPSVFHYNSARQFIADIFRYKQEQNSRFSMRAFSARCGLSVSILSNYLNGKRVLSLQSAIRIGDNLKIGDLEKECLLGLIQLEMDLPLEIKQEISRKVEGFQNIASKKIVDSIEELRKNSEVLDIIRYVKPGTGAIRQLIFLRDKATKKKLKTFIDHFSDPMRLVSSNSYFIPNGEGSYKVHLVDISKGSFFPTLQSQGNLNLKVDFSDDGFPSIYKVRMKNLNTGALNISDLIFSKEKMSQNYFSTDDPDSDQVIRSISWSRLTLMDQKPQ